MKHAAFHINIHSLLQSTTENIGKEEQKEGRKLNITVLKKIPLCIMSAVRWTVSQVCVWKRLVLRVFPQMLVKMRQNISL